MESVHTSSLDVALFGDVSTISSSSSSSSSPNNQQNGVSAVLDEVYFDRQAVVAQGHIQVRNGCVLIPIVFAAWWYWTRRAAKRAMRSMRLLLTGGDAACFPQEQTATDLSDNQSAVDAAPKWEDVDVENRVPAQTQYDKFDTWEDVVAQESSSAHMVRWITFTTRKKAKQRRIKAVTKKVMNRQRYRTSQSTTATAPDDDMLSLPPNCDGLLSVDDALSSSGCSHWECIDNGVIEIEFSPLPPPPPPRPIPRCLADDVSQQSGGVLT